jgi:hypothetical protein
MNRHVIGYNFRWSAIDEMCGREKSLIPILLRYRCICKKGKTYVNNVTVFSLNDTILLVSVRARHKM